VLRVTARLVRGRAVGDRAGGGESQQREPDRTDGQVAVLPHLVSVSRNNQVQRMSDLPRSGIG